MRKGCVFLFVIILCFCSCNLGVVGESVNYDKNKDLEGVFQGENEDRIWTILVYMSGDNNLESAAIADLCEMEKSKLDTSKVTLLALVDRSDVYDYSNGNWTGTRLYKIRTGKASGVNEITSEEIECKPLGLSIGKETKLDMSSRYVLSEALAYMVEKFPAENYGLFMWGHGTGWRNDLLEDNSGTFKGFAFDESAGTYMSLKQLGLGIESVFVERKLDLAGFDTCFGGELEVFYELKDSVAYAIGSEGLVASSGWNYESLFNYINQSRSLNPEDLCRLITKQFSKEYGSYSRSSICGADLSRIGEFTNAFSQICNIAANYIEDIEVHDKVMDVLYSGKDCKTEKYTYGLSGYDVYLDVCSVALNLRDYFTKDELTEKVDEFLCLKEKTFVESWASDRSEGGLGVFFSSLSEGGILSAVHPSLYISGKTVNQGKFVSECSGWVPSVSQEKGLLNKLFYKDFSLIRREESCE